MDDSKFERVTVTALAPFPFPCLGTLQGESVRITHLGDAEGMSPVYHVIDSRGNAGWVEASKVQISDPNYLPISQEQLSSLSSAQSSSSQRSSSLSGSR